jgi:pimeloyl-ACP methyl ester carboxylesterase
MDGEILEIGGCDILVERLGAGDPLVVLHGEAGPRGARPFLEKLAETFEVHVPRHPGWAGTRSAVHVRTARDVAFVAQQYIGEIGRPVPVVGLSFGGWIAAEIAAVAPRLVSSLVLVSPIGVKIGGVEERDLADVYLLAADDRHALYYREGLKPPVPEAEDGTDIFAERALAEHATTRYGWSPYMHDPGLKGRLQAIRSPTLLLSGGGDRLVVNPQYYAGYAGHIPGARHEVVAEAGHRLEEEAPHDVAARVAAFFATAPGVRARVKVGQA